MTGHPRPPIVAFTVYGQCYSMKNSKVLTNRGGRPRAIMHPKAGAFAQAFAHQVPPGLRVGIAYDVASEVRVFYPSRRQDLDCAIVYDLLQATGVIANDRLIKSKREEWALDPGNPRVEIALYPYSPSAATC